MSSFLVSFAQRHADESTATPAPSPHYRRPRPSKARQAPPCQSGRSRTQLPSPPSGARSLMPNAAPSSGQYRSRRRSVVLPACGGLAPTTSARRIAASAPPGRGTHKRLRRFAPPFPPTHVTHHGPRGQPVLAYPLTSFRGPDLTLPHSCCILHKSPMRGREGV